MFATTEIRKVPVTVLSRCQRFDLRRIEPSAMMAHLGQVATAEGAKVGEDALGLITRAAEGSVRDALSLLDQAIAMGAGPVGAAEVRAMLGLADRGRVIDLFEAVMRGDAAGALAELGAQYADGAEPGVVLRDLAEVTHWVSVLKVSPEMADDPTVAPEERARGQALAARLGMPALARAWQMLLKALEELPLAPNALMAAEMALIRLTHVAELPPPGELMRRLSSLAEGGGAGPLPAPAASQPAGLAEPSATGPGRPAELGPANATLSGTRPPQAELRSVAQSGLALATSRPAAMPETAVLEETPPALEGLPESFEAALALLEAHRELRLLDAATAFVELVAFRPGYLEFSPAPGASGDLAGRLQQTLSGITGIRWSVAVSDARGAPTLAARRAADAARARDEARAHPLVSAALAAFPGAEIMAVRPIAEVVPALPGPGEVLTPVPEDGEEAPEDSSAEAMDEPDLGLVDWDDAVEED